MFQSGISRSAPKSALMLAVGIVLLASCTTSGGSASRISKVSVKFDPYDYNIADLRETATAECQAKDPRSFALKDDEPIENTGSVKWSYMSFGCYL